MHSITQPPNNSSPSSPSMSLADFDYDSDLPVELMSIKEPGSISRPTSAIRINRTEAVASPFMSPDLRDDVATQSDIEGLRTMIQQELSLLKDQLPKSSPSMPPPSTAAIPAEAFTDAIRAELALQMAKVSVLEEENRKLCGEKQALRAQLDGAGDSHALRAELDAANAERKSMYVERQGLWDERAGLWSERQSLWDERGELWKERGQLWEEREDLWVVRDKLKGQVTSLIQAKIEAGKD